MVLLALLACSTCPSFEETEIVGATAEQQAEIEAAMADLQEWTGLDRICVGEVEVVPQDELPDLHGKWTELAQRIQIRGDLAPERFHEVMVHELCHALDDRLELSIQAPDLFTGDYIQSEHYDTDSMRRQEDFADACQLGPAVDQPLPSLLGPECGLDLGLTEREAWLMDHAFLWPDTSAWQGARRAVSLGEATDRPEPPAGDVYEDVLWAGVRWQLRATELPTVAGPDRAPYLEARHPLTREVLAQVPLPLQPQQRAELRQAQLVPGDDGLYLVLADESGTTVRVDDQLQADLVPSLLGLHGANRLALAIHGGRLFFTEDQALQLLDLETGEQQAIDHPAPLNDLVQPWQPLVQGDTLSWIDNARLPVTVDLATARVTPTPVPAPAWVMAGAPLDDGRWVLAAIVTADFVVPVVYEPDTLSWHLPQAPCALGFEEYWDDLVPTSTGPWLETLAEPGMIRPLLLPD